jgi:hypothetical protein
MTGMERASTKSDWLGSDVTKRDHADFEAHNIAEDAASMNRAYRTVTREQAEDLWRAVDELIELAGRVEQ